VRSISWRSRPQEQKLLPRPDESSVASEGTSWTDQLGALRRHDWACLTLYSHTPPEGVCRVIPDPPKVGLGRARIADENSLHTCDAIPAMPFCLRKPPFKSIVGDSERGIVDKKWALNKA